MISSNKINGLIVFIFISTIYLITRYILFNGFHGRDDLHYAMLSSRLLHGTYNPFNENDIFSGRILLVAIQALIYKIAGISVFSTQAGAIIATVIACYLTVFHLIEPVDEIKVLMGTSLFYFNPVLIGATQGILPDAYIMLTWSFIMIILKRIFRNEGSKKDSIINGVFIGILTAISMLIKEISLLFIPVACIIFRVRNKKSDLYAAFSVFGSFLLTILLIGIMYFHFTGNFFFKLSQINNSEYSLCCQNMAIRLTYGFWKGFIIAGFYPVVIGMGILIVQIIRRGIKVLSTDFFLLSFLLLLIFSCYFPFSLHTYSPMRLELRHFLYLLPASVVVVSPYLYNNLAYRKGFFLIIISLSLMMFCLLSTPNKWQWMIYVLIAIYFLAQYFIPVKSSFFRTMCIVFILWLGMMEPLWLGKPKWFYDLRKLNNSVVSKCYYFPEHDNMMHWSLLHKFDPASGEVFNIEPNPFFIFKHYYKFVDSASFKPGWFFVNKVYTSRSNQFLKEIDSLRGHSFFSREKLQGDIEVLYIDRFVQLEYLKLLIAQVDG